MGQKIQKVMLEKFAYYCLVYPLSLLPLRVLYLMTDLFFLLLITVFPYRKKVIDKNLKLSFPELSDHVRKKIKRKFYRHFTDILAEGIKNLSFSKKQYSKRVTVKNNALMERLYSEGRNVLLVSGHYNNWEWIITAQDMIFRHKAFGIGKRMTSKFWDQKVNQRRNRFGMTVIHRLNQEQVLEDYTEKPHAVLLLSDQSPTDPLKCYWTQFLNQETAVIFGAELLANQKDYAVVFFATKKVKRGHYELELELITENASDTKWGEITEAHTKLLEKVIRKSPEYWLWSHKRWKRVIPDNFEELKSKQEKRFNEKFNK